MNKDKNLRLFVNGVVVEGSAEAITTLVERLTQKKKATIARQEPARVEQPKKSGSRFWTDGEVSTLRELVAQKVPLKTVAKTVGRTNIACKNKMKKLGINYWKRGKKHAALNQEKVFVPHRKRVAKRGKPYTSEDVAYIMEHAGRQSKKTIARKLHRSVASVGMKASELGVSLRKKKLSKQPTAVQQPSPTKKQDVWIENEIAYLAEKKNRKHSMHALGMALRRSPNAVGFQIYKHFGGINEWRSGAERKTSPIADKIVPSKKSVSPPKEVDGRVKRMSFINSRANKYCRDFAWSWEKAFNQAIRDWDSRGRAIGAVKQSKVTPQPGLWLVDTEFPTLSPLTAEGSKLFSDVIRQNLLENKHPIGYFDVKDWLPLARGEWSGLAWRELLGSFLKQHEAIRKYFNLKGSFVVSKNSKGYDVIDYKGDKQ